MWNPLYDKWASVHQLKKDCLGYHLLKSRDLDEQLAAYQLRHTSVREYAFAVPTPEAVRQILQIAPRIVDFGAGTGYWAKILTAAGGDVVAIDNVQPGTLNSYMDGQEIGKWFPVQHGNVSDLACHSDRALLLCWPPYNDSTASDAVKAWGGNVVIYIGEGWGGCTADDSFFELMKAEFEDGDDIDIPHWYGVRDYIQIYRRRGYEPPTRKIELED